MSDVKESVQQKYGDVLKELVSLDKDFNEKFQTYVAKRSSLIARGKELEKTLKDSKKP